MPAPRKYPLPELQVGEVTFLPEKKNLADYVRIRGLQLGRKFKTKRVGTERKVVRIA